MYVLTSCHVTDINHVLTPCHVTEINYVDRGVAARTPLQSLFTAGPCTVASELLSTFFFVRLDTFFLSFIICTVANELAS